MDANDVNKQKMEDAKPSISNGDEISSARPNRLTPAAHATAIIAMSFSMLTHSWLLISVFPYSGFMAIHLVPSLNEETAGSYAGLIASAFMIGRALTSYSWGKVADRYGRKFVVISSLVMSLIFSILFGISPTFSCALLWRFFLGLGNGLVGTSKTILSEVAYGDELRETRGMGIAMGMWGWGFLFSPALSGVLAEPAKQYPNSVLVRAFPIVSKYPFILPNLMSGVFCALAIVIVALFVPETLPADQMESPKQIPRHLYEWLRSKFSTTTEESQNLISESPTTYGTVRVNGHGTNNGSSDDDDCEKAAQMCHTESCSMLATASPRRSKETKLMELNMGKLPEMPTVAPAPKALPPPATLKSIWSQPDTRNYLLVYWMYSFAAVAVDEGFPLFCISHRGGLGLTEASIGKILSGSGLIYVICQYFVYAAIVERFGVERSIAIGAWCSGPMLCLIPISLLLNGEGGSLSWPALVFLCTVFAWYRVFGSVFFSSVTVATNRTVAPSHRGTMNGMSMLGGSFAKGFGPTFSGVLVASFLSSETIPPRVGASLIWLVIGSLGVVTSFMALAAVRGKVR